MQPTTRVPATQAPAADSYRDRTSTTASDSAGSSDGFSTDLNSASRKQSDSKSDSASSDGSDVTVSQAAKRAKRAAEDAALQAGIGATGATPASPIPVAVKTPGDKNFRVMDSVAERLPATQMSAVSLKSADYLTDSSPWSKDWVFSREDAENPNLKTLLDKKPLSENSAALPASKGAITSMQGLMEELRQAEMRADALDAQVGAIDVGEKSMMGPAVSGRGQNALGGAASAAQMNGQAGDISQLLGQMNGQVLSQNAALQGMADQGIESPAGMAPDTQFGELGGSEFLAARQAAVQGRTGMATHALNAGTAANPVFGTGLASAVELNARGQNAGQNKNNPESLTDPYSGPVQSFVARPHDGVGSSLVHAGAAMPVITGQTTQGAMARDRLASESLKQVSQQIALISTRGAGAQNGEMRIRLRPDDLGEIQLRVSANGNQVNLQIQASDDRAKKIIEESLVHLKDSLAGQNLVLTKADVGVGALAHGMSFGSHDRGGSMDSQQQQPQNHQQPNSGAWNMAQDGAQQQRGGGQQNSRSGGSQDGGFDNGVAASRVRAMNAAGAARAARASDQGRLDITA